MTSIATLLLSTFGNTSRGATQALGLAAAAVFGAAIIPPAHAADAFPSKQIRVVLPFPPGGGVDATARLVGQKLAESLKQSVVIDNRPGANGMLGTDVVAKAAPDGYTVLFTDRGSLGINPSLYKQLPYNPTKDFQYVGIVAWAPYILVAHPKVPANTFAELVEYARKNPGKLNYASFGPGSMPQIGMESLNRHYGMNIVHVPYKGGGPAAVATLAGEVDLTLATLGTVTGSLKNGGLKAFVLGGGERSPMLPQLPTIAEEGGDRETIPGTYFGFAFPAKTPNEIVARFASEVRRIVNLPEVSERLINNGFQVGKVSPEEMSSLVRRDVAEFARITKAIGVQAE